VLSALAAVWTLGAGAVAVSGASSCPAPAEVQRQVDTLVSGGPLHTARIERVGERLELTLLDEHGAQLAEKWVQPKGTCAQLAQVASVIIAAWESELRERIAELPQRAPPPGAPEPRRFRVELSAAAVASWAITWSFGAEARAALGVAGSPWVGEAALIFVAPRQWSLGNGNVRWYRLALSLGPSYRFDFGGPRLDLHAAFIAALLGTSGVGYAVNQSQNDFDPAATAGARFSLRLGPVRARLGAAAVAWFREQQVRVGTVMASGVQASGLLPRFEVWVTLGGSLEL
jgi:uncharacterized membrane protein YgcG